MYSIQLRQKVSTLNSIVKHALVYSNGELKECDVRCYTSDTVILQYYSSFGRKIT